MNSKPHSGLFFGFVILLIILAGCKPAVAPTVAPTAVVNTPLPTALPTEPQTATVEPQPSEVIPSLENAVSFPDPSLFTWEVVAQGLEKPTDLAALPDGSGILLIVEQKGLIRIVQDGIVRTELFLDLTDRVGDSGSEQGLLGLALDPEYAANGIFCLNYTDKDGNTVVSRFHRMGDSIYGDTASEEILLQVNQPYANHNGGNLEFGPDGMLYIGLGDGGSGGDPQGNAQNPDTLLGKMLRLDVRGKDTYTIPADNPFVNGGGRQEIWAMGLRNPWRYSFDSLTGDLYIADVGQNKYEEVNFLPAGSPAGVNFGWDFYEGTHAYEGNPPEGTSFVEPVFEYDHGSGCSVTGGYVYRGQVLPEFYGIYLLGDYCSGVVWGLLRDANGQWSAQQLFQLPANISAFGQDSRGEIYLLDHRTGSVYLLTRK